MRSSVGSFKAGPAAHAEVEIEGVHHVGFLTEDLQQSLAFYEGVLGLKTNPDRPDERLPYGGEAQPALPASDADKLAAHRPAGLTSTRRHDGSGGCCCC